MGFEVKYKESFDTEITLISKNQEAQKNVCNSYKHGAQITVYSLNLLAKLKLN